MYILVQDTFLNHCYDFIAHLFNISAYEAHEYLEVFVSDACHVHEHDS